MSRWKPKLGVLASGRGSNLEAIFDAIEKGIVHAQVSVVVSDREDAQALGRSRKRGVHTVYVDPKNFVSREAFDEHVAHVLQGHGVDLVILAGFMRIITSALIRPFRNQIMNIHPSLLPSFPGLAAQRQALEYGVKITGCSVHFVEEKVDGGPVIIQAAVPVFDEDTEETLSERILAQEHRIYPLAIQLFVEDRLRVHGRRVEVRDGDEADGRSLTQPSEGGQ
jgi:phosphoribosylglycinamide formyltransferase 1